MASPVEFERLLIFTPLGIRFWDLAFDQPVTDDLVVTARPANGQAWDRRTAFRTASGNYAFANLPGLHDLEYPLQDPLISGLPGPQRFIVEVADRQSRYLPAVFAVDVPYLGLYPTQSTGGSPGATPPGVYLFSAPTRPALPNLGVVRGQLLERLNGDTRPAAYAVIEAEGPDAAIWYGMADERGSFALLLPYPRFPEVSHSQSPAGSPPAPAPVGWDLLVRVRYAPATLTVPAGSTLPDLRSILNQAPGRIWSTRATQPGQPLGQLAARLMFNQELILRTDAGSTLLISPAP